MSITRSLHWVVNKVWLLTAILLVVAAVVISGLRYALPYLPDVSRQLEQQIEERLEQPVSIQQLAMSWHRQGPALDVNSIRLTEGENSPVNVQVDKISVVMDFWQSILQRQIVAQEFILNGANIDIDLRRWQQNGETQLNLKRLESLFLQRLQRFSLTDSEISVTTLAGSQRSIVIERLSWLNQGEQHQGVGQLRVRDFTSNSLDFIVQLQGNRLNEADGQFYIDSRQIDISPWLEQQLGEVDILASNVNFTSWFNIAQGKLSQGFLQLRDNRIQVAANGHELDLHVPSGSALLEPTSSGWLLNSQPMKVEVNQQSFELPRVAWQSINGQHHLSTQQLPADKFLPLFELFGESAQQWSVRQQAADTQALLDISIERNDSGEFSWLVKANELTSHGNGRQPSWSPLQAVAAGNEQYGIWSLAGTGLTLSGKQLSTEKAWTINKLALSGQWYRKADVWQATLADGSVRVDDLELALEGRLTGDSQQSPVIAVHASSRKPFTVDTARKLLPNAMGSGVQDYLQGALAGGQAAGLEILWRGPVTRFPSSTMKGVFNARLEFSKLDYRFQDDWPMLADAPLRLDFFQQQLAMYSDGGRVLQATVNEVDAIISDLSSAASGLQLSSDISAAPKALRQVFEQSPLTAVSATLQQVIPKQPINGQFTLDIPFDGSRQPEVTVAADLSGQQLVIPAIEQQFTVRSGELNIHNDKVTTHDLQLDWYGRPIDTKVIGSNSDSDYQLTVDTQIDWQLEPLLDRLPMQGWQRYFYGAVNGSGKLRLAINEQVQVDWQSQYDLTGLQSNLPPPWAKEFGENWQLTVNLSGNDERLSLQADVGQRLQWQSQWQPGEERWQSAQLTIGDPTVNAAIPPASVVADKTHRDEGGAFVVAGALPSFDVAAWYDFIYFLRHGEQESTGKVSSRGALLPTYVNITTPNLYWAGQEFADAELEAWPQNDGWKARLHAHDLAVEMQVPNNFLQQPIEVDADFIQLTSDFKMEALQPKADQSSWQWVSRIPALSLRCKTCKLDEQSFSDVALELQPIDGGVALTSLELSHNNSTLTGAGHWLVESEQPTTQISGSISTPDVGDLFRQYGLETAIRDSAADINFGLNWQGAPHQPEVSSLNGAINWDLGKGYLAEVSDGGARLFSLLSLDGILRKLTLDFRDIFSQGMFYTDLTGSVQVTDGLAHTDDTQMLGSAGNMEINGSTNLVTEQLDYQLTYAPKVTSSLPVILAWMVNPPSGLAALLIDKVLQDAEVISQLRYQVTGTIADPQVTEVERDSRPVDIPELEQSQQESDDDTTTDSGTAQ